MTATVTAIPSSDTPVTLLADNPNRKHASVFNNADEPLLVKLGPDASDEDFTVRVVPNGFYEIPTWPDSDPRRAAPQTYTGIVSGVWEIEDPAGDAQATEVE